MRPNYAQSCDHDAATTDDFMAWADTFDWVPKPFDEAALETDCDMTHRVKRLVLNFMDRSRSFAAEDICGSIAWHSFTDDEKYQTEYLISELIVDLNLPLRPIRDQRYPEPRRYFFTSQLNAMAGHVADTMKGAGRLTSAKRR
jgi:hypothetical protein